MAGVMSSEGDREILGTKMRNGGRISYILTNFIPNIGPARWPCGQNVCHEIEGSGLIPGQVKTIKNGT